MQKKHGYKTLSIIFFLCILLCILLLQVKVDAYYLDVIFVVLHIRSEERIIHSDYFFEIIQMPDYVLIPVGHLAVRLELETTYQREKNVLTITHTPSGRSCDIDFNHEIYIEHPGWASEPPLLYEGDFYVTPRLIEALTDVFIKWDLRRQEIVITGDWPLEDDLEEDLDLTLRKRPRVELAPDIVGPDYSLGSISYQVSFEAKSDIRKEFSYGSRQIINIHGRAGDWFYDVGLNSFYNITRGELKLSVPLLRATYIGEDILFVLGDYVMMMPKTLGRKSFRGSLYSSPITFSSQTIPYTSIIGQADVGDRVSVFINGVPYGEKFIYEEEAYLFEQVPLVKNRVNEIRVVIRGADGKVKDTIVSTVVGAPGILPAGTEELAVLTGQYRSAQDRTPEGNMLGILYNKAFTPNLSFGWEFIADSPYTLTGDEHVKLGSIVGVTARGFDNTVFKIDLLTGFKDDKLKSGLHGSFLLGLADAHLEASCSYIPPEVRDPIKVNPGFTMGLGASQDLTGDWGLNVQSVFFRSLQGMEYQSANRAFMAFSHQDSWHSSSLLKGNLGTGSFADNTETIVDFREAGLGLEHTRRTATTQGTGKVDYSVSFFDFEPDETNYLESLSLKANISHALTSSLRLSTSAEILGQGIDRELQEAVLEYDVGLRWSIGRDTFISSFGKVTASLNEKTGGQLELNTGKIDLSLLHYFSHDSSLRLKGEYNYLGFVNDDYYSAELSFKQYLLDRRVDTAFSIGYKSPVATRPTHQWSFGVNLGYTFESQLKIDFEARRSFPTVFEPNPEHLFKISVGQTIGFTTDRVLGLKPSISSEPQQFIAGMVFLDQNGNGVYDEGEPLLQGIQMSLEGRRAVTDEKGMFMFERVRPDIYRLGFDLDALYAEYSIVTDRKIVQIRENENLFVYFGLTLNGIISGRIFLDYDGTGVFDAGDEALSFVELYIESLNRTIYTRRDGTFYLENVPLGEHTIRIMSSSLPSYTTAGEMAEFTIQITEEQLAAENIIIPVIYVFDI